MRKPSGSAERLSEMIKQAMEDGRLTTKEHNQIMAIADEDGILDNQEKRLLAELQEMLANGTIKRVSE
jgi:tellurite resistance protein